MESLDETLSHLAASTPEVTVEETLRLLGPSFPAGSMAVIPDDPSTTESTQQLLQKRIINLALQTFVLMRHKRNIKEASGKLEAKSRQLRDALSRFNRPCIPKHVLIRFVSTLDEANRYFDFKIRAKQDHVLEHLSSPDDVSRILLQDRQLRSEFPKISDAQLKQAANAIFWEFYYQHLGSEHAHPFQDPILHDWIYKLAFKTRQQGYPIDNDPILELEKLMESAPFVYKDYFLSQKLPECTDYFLSQKLPEECTDYFLSQKLLEECTDYFLSQKLPECTDYFLSQQLPVECTESSEQEAVDNYSGLVSRMLGKYKEGSNEKLKFICAATNAGHGEAFSEKHEVGVTYVVTSARNKEASNDRNRLTPTDTKSKRSLEMTDAIYNMPKKLKRAGKQEWMGSCAIQVSLLPQLPKER